MEEATRDLAVALLCNLDNIGSATGGLTQSVADIYLADLLAPRPATSATATPPPVSLSADELARKVGLYRNPSNESVGRIFLRNGTLMASPDVSQSESVELTPVSANRFIVRGTAIGVEFVPAAPGRPQAIHVTGAGPKPVVSQQVTTSFAPSGADLRAFVGEYTSPELDATYKLAAHDSGLVIRMPGRADVLLEPIFPDAFAGAIVGVVKFSRDARGLVTGFTVNTSSVRSLRFDRVKP